MSSSHLIDFALSPDASALVFVSDPPPECGVRPLMHKNGRIVGGKGATFGEWPWQVLVRESTWLGLFTKNKCGGVLITSKFVVTAAHCQPGSTQLLTHSRRELETREQLIQVVADATSIPRNEPDDMHAKVQRVTACLQEHAGGYVVVHPSGHSLSFSRMFLANLVAVFGEFDISGELESKRSITKNVKRVIVHRHYDAATFANDLALLELESPVSFDTHIVPICMPQDNEDFTGRMATVTGWGRLKYGESMFRASALLPVRDTDLWYVRVYLVEGGGQCVYDQGH
uniref:Peptidase S1 domain-containing protein n=1 Tax=Timema poppense TaxID=170557 RepID=A0A7R9HBY7_TIMPO|nr:unnamed protein product [Timema poppensis]